MGQTIFNIYEAKASLSRLVDRVASGEEVIIAKAGKPMAKLVPIASARNRRQPGGWEGQVHIADDFDDPLPNDIQSLFEGAETSD